MAKKTKDESPALRLVQLVYAHEGHGRGRSNYRSDCAPHAALSLAIRYGLRFAPDDFELMARSWTDEPRGMGFVAGERDYSLACSRDRRDFGVNRSACQAFEHWKKRKPFIVKTADCRSGYRIAVGTRFPWLCQWVTCTSFAEDGTSLTACSYKGVPHDGYTAAKIERRFKITHEKLREAN